MDQQALRQQYGHQAIEIFNHNLQHGYSAWKQKPFRFISPASTEYVFQWLWDSSFHAIVLSHLDPAWAKRELLSHMEGQRADGFIPHVIFWQEDGRLPYWAYIESDPWVRRIRTTAITQPPMLAIAAEAAYRAEPEVAFLEDIVDGLDRYHRWLKDNRDPDGDDLVSVISPNESGMDELPVFQEVSGYMGLDAAKLHYYYRKPDLLNQIYRYDTKKILQAGYFDVEEVLFNCVFVEASRSLARLCIKAGREELADWHQKQADKTEVAILEKCWNEDTGLFYSIYSKQEKMSSIKTVASLLPLFLDGLPHDRARRLVEEHLLNEKEFWTAYPVPSVARDERFYAPGQTPAYELKLLWRGPTWMNTNWFVVKGLRKHGFDEVADDLVGRMVAMVEQSGFREYYNPETGEGYRRKDFGWSTLLVDLI